MDETGLKILKILQEKARIPNVEVARQVGMAPSAVLERIRKLENQGYINGYEVILDPEKFNRNIIAFIHVYVEKNLNAGDEIAKIDDVQEVHYLTGVDCFFVKVRVKDNSELDSLIRKKISSIKGVKSTKTSIAVSTFKETSRIPIEL
ncbi:MAG: Lrp/AsnC family transcriptional regulator [Desulfobacterales bacterium]|nr:Lrp/AsnC family transcriptional regulator [Desulfobacterales bacterium]MCP4162464.1 Lrp/AsnC family transcriptional regulator [Deltaproteobacteria bacterium]